jgi:hypothetical protein
LEDGRSGRQRAGLRHEVEVGNMNKGTVARAAVESGVTRATRRGKGGPAADGGSGAKYRGSIGTRRRWRAGARDMEVVVGHMEAGTVARAAVQVVEDRAVATTGENPLTVARTAASTAGRRSKRR